VGLVFSEEPEVGTLALDHEIGRQRIVSEADEDIAPFFADPLRELGRRLGADSGADGREVEVGVLATDGMGTPAGTRRFGIDPLRRRERSALGVRDHVGAVAGATALQKRSRNDATSRGGGSALAVADAVVTVTADVVDARRPSCPGIRRAGARSGEGASKDVQAFGPSSCSVSAAVGE
jgi:hypothetical protein